MKKTEKNSCRKKHVPNIRTYAVKEPMELMEFLVAKNAGRGRTKLKSLLSKRVVLVDNVITFQFNFPLQPGMKVQISKEKERRISQQTAENCM